MGKAEDPRAAPPDGPTAAAPTMAPTPTGRATPARHRRLNDAPSALCHLLGIDPARRDNLISLSTDEVLYVAGSCIVSLDLRTERRRYAYSASGRGIGCITADPGGGRLFAGEKGTPDAPQIVVFDLPGFGVAKRLRGGAERGYAALDLCPDGSRLCTVASAPDYSLTVWDWDRERIILKTKAFGQEVFGVRFSPFAEGSIVTSGSGHIRFWKMAETFTGLKLQGDIGKFGKVDLSDVEAFAELPNGTVVSGSETGHLLLWEGGFVKCRFVVAPPPVEGGADGDREGRGTTDDDDDVAERDGAAGGDDDADADADALGGGGEGPVPADARGPPEEAGPPAHRGGVSHLHYDDGAGLLMSAGADGRIRWWPRDALEAAEADADASVDFPIRPVRTLRVGGGDSLIRAVAPRAGAGGGALLVQLRSGALVGVDDPEDGGASGVSALWDFHGGPVRGVACSPVDRVAATAGEDGSVRFWDYPCERCVAASRFDAGCSSLCWVPPFVDATNRSVCAGFEDGVVRILYLAEDGAVPRQATRPHSGPVRAVTFSSDGRFAATGGDDGTVFLFECATIESGAVLSPVGFVKFGGAVAHAAWRPGARTVLVTTGAGEVIEADVGRHLDGPAGSGDTYLLEMGEGERREIRAPAENAEEGGDGEGAAESEESCRCLFAAYGASGSTILRSWAGGRLGSVVTEHALKGGDLVREYPLGIDGADNARRRPQTKFIGLGPNGNILLTGADDGSATVRTADDPSAFLTLRKHDDDAVVAGAAMGAGPAGDFVLTAGSDGLLAVHRVDAGGIIGPADVDAGASEGGDPYAFRRVTGDAEGFAPVPPATEPRISGSLAEAPDRTGGAGGAAAYYSLQEERVRRRRDSLELAAERRKAAAREAVSGLRAEYADLAAENAALPKAARLSADEMVVDPDLAERMEEFRGECLAEVERECAYESERSALRRAKLEATFVRTRECGHWVVSGLRSGRRVQTLAARALPASFWELLSSLEEEDSPEEFAAEKETGSDEAAIESRGDESLPHEGRKSESPKNSEIRSSTFQARKAMRAKRKEDLQAKLAERPDENADDPSDVAAIREAEANLGNYEVRSTLSNNITADERLRELLFLELAMHRTRTAFNEELVQLRDGRRALVSSIREGNERVRSIDKELGDGPTDLWEPADCHEAQEDVRNSESDGAGDADPSDGEPDRHSSLQSVLAVLMPDTNEVDEKEKQLLLRHERGTILEKLEANIAAFDETLYELRKRRFRLVSELKAAELQLSAILREWEALRGVRSDPTAVQERQNQERIHELPVTIPLSSGQMFVWEKEAEDPSNGRILTETPDMDCVVFSNQHLIGLRHRIVELKDEILTDRQRFKDLKREKGNLDKASQLKEEEIREQLARCDELQLLKFGHLVDIEALDEMCVDSGGEAAVLQRAASAERGNEQRMSDLQKQYMTLKERALDLTNENTSILSRIADLSGRQLALERGMRNKQKAPSVDESVAKVEDEERRQLTDVTEAQAKRIQALRQEIRVLKRKDCHIFDLPPPPTSRSSGLEDV